MGVETLYRITTDNACFGVIVQDGVVTQAAPIAKLAGGEAWADVAGRYRDAELIPPVGWEIQAGAGGWRCVNRARLWSTDVFLDKDGMSGQERAIAAAETLEREAWKTIAARERLCEDLRKAFRS